MPPLTAAPPAAPVPVAEVRGPPLPSSSASSLSASPSPSTSSSHLSAPLSATAPPATPPSAEPAHVLCDVCCEHVSPAILRGCASCVHRYCLPCVDKYWTGAIYSGNHARLLCMYGGCGVFATDPDIRAVVSPRTFRKMLYFRSRDRHHACPDARWCANDMCWEFLGLSPAPSPHRPLVTCPRCAAATCLKCDRVVPPLPAKHVCAARKPNKAHAALFSLWATVHTKACPACAARIQRNHGCSHMTCTRCSSYFCWRCKGFLNNGCPLPGRACICDRVITAAAYSGLAVAGIIGSPVIVTAILIGGAPYGAYRVIKGRRERRRNRRSPPGSAPLDSATSLAALRGGPNPAPHRLGAAAQLALGLDARPAPRLGRAPGRVLQPDEMVVQEDEDFDSGSTRLTAFSEVMVAEARGLVRPGRRLRMTGSGSSGLDAQFGLLMMDEDEKTGGETEDTDDPFVGEDGFESTSEDEETEEDEEDDEEDNDGEEEEEDVEEAAPGANMETCKVTRPFVLERRRGSVGGARVARRAVQ